MDKARVQVEVTLCYSLSIRSSLCWTVVVNLIATTLQWVKEGYQHVGPENTVKAQK